MLFINQNQLCFTVNLRCEIVLWDKVYSYSLENCYKQNLAFHWTLQQVCMHHPHTWKDRSTFPVSQYCLLHVLRVTRFCDAMSYGHRNLDEIIFKRVCEQQRKVWYNKHCPGNELGTRFICKDNVRLARNKNLYSLHTLCTNCWGRSLPDWIDCEEQTLKYQSSVQQNWKLTLQLAIAWLLLKSLQ